MPGVRNRSSVSTSHIYGAWSTQPIERLDIPHIWMADGPHGLRRAPSTDTWGYGDQLPATCFPTSSALSATWDVELVSEVGAALGDEARALGVNMLLGPGVNIKRSPTSMAFRPGESEHHSSILSPTMSKPSGCGPIPTSMKGRSTKFT
jgi:beta-glucosidase-like glycosyl hydrolase